MQFKVGGMEARCPKCNATDFEFLDGARSRSPSTFRCTSCGATTTYTTLLDQITTEVARQAADLLRRLKKE